MIFPGPIVRAIMRGEVTQARRPVVASEPYYRPSRRLKSTPSRVLVTPFNPRNGDRLIVRSQGSESGHVIVQSATQMPAGSLTFEDARQMGYRTTSEAMGAWLSTFDQAWVCEDGPCEACGGPGVRDGFCVTCGCSDQVQARFIRKHADRLVWVIRFEVDPIDAGRYLAARPVPDYVSSPSRAAHGEPQVLSASEFERHVAKREGMTTPQWQAVEKATRDTELERLSLGQRLDRAIAEAKAQGRFSTAEVRVIEQRLKALEKRAA